jgi:hypothetical protein
MVKLIPYDRSFASHEKTKYWSKNNIKLPSEVFKFCNKKYLFNCDICNHEFSIRLDHISRGVWCKFCTGMQLCNSYNCTVCFNKSFASHEKAQYWSELNTVKPIEIFKNTHQKFWFNCGECNHSFNITLSSIIFGSWCPYCSIPTKKICIDNDCNHCFNRSFASHEKAKYWSELNNISPREIFKSSNNKYWFNCDKCNHRFQAELSNVCYNKWCPYCSEYGRLLCEKEDCIFCFNKSFASHEKVKYFSNINNISPRNLLKCSSTKYIFNCNICSNEFNASLDCISRGTWCPLCKKKSEHKLFEWLKNKFNTVIHQPKYEWCRNVKTNAYLPFDFEINSNIIIELDGLQHFKQVSTWKSPEIQRERDIYKMKCANTNNKNIIRLLQEDVWLDKNDWENKLLNAIYNINNDTYTIQYINIDSKYYEDVSA